MLKPVTVNNSTYINKTSKHLSPQIIEHSTTTTKDIGNPVTVLV
jgi:hypothetical protein